MRQSRSGFACGVTVLVAFVAACATPLRESSWVVAETPHFEIHSTLSADRTRELGDSLERFRALVLAVTNAKRTEGGDGGERTRIFAFGSLAKYSQFGPKGSTGFLLSRMRRDVMVVAVPSRRVGTSEIVLHEFVHQLLRNVSSRIPPIWYDEGMAELFSTARTKGEMLELGAIAKLRVGSLHVGTWLPVERMLSIRAYSELSGDELAMFYAQSWLLVHYLTFDRPDGLARIGAQMERYLELAATSKSPADAFEAAFGLSPADADVELRALFDRGRLQRFGYPLSKLDLGDAQPRVRTPTSSEIATGLGELALELGKRDVAEREFRAALEVDEANARAQAGLGGVLESAMRHPEAERHFLRAVALDERDPRNLLDLAEFYAERGLQTATSRDALVADLGRAREVLARAIALDATRAEAWMALGQTYLAPGEDPGRAIVHLERAFRLRPSAAQTLGLLAEAWLARGDEIEARKILEAMFGFRRDAAPVSSVDQAIAEMRRARRETARRIGIEATTGAGSRSAD